MIYVKTMKKLKDTDEGSCNEEKLSPLDDVAGRVCTSPRIVR